MHNILLYQNTPNPFNENTSIKCYVPELYKKAELCIYDIQGAQVSCINIENRGNVELQLQANSLKSGIYAYIIIADGISSEAKQMILTK